MTTNRKYFLLLVLPFTLATWDAIADAQRPGGANAQRTTEERSPSGEQLWADNCLRCHNIRPPQMYTPVQWQIIVHHMRIRANLTGADARAIADFLKSASH